MIHAIQNKYPESGSCGMLVFGLGIYYISVPLYSDHEAFIIVLFQFSSLDRQANDDQCDSYMVRT